MHSPLRRCMKHADIANPLGICKALPSYFNSSQPQERPFDSPQRLCYATLTFTDGIPAFVNG
jgi:hypothetical protein